MTIAPQMPTTLEGAQVRLLELREALALANAKATVLTEVERAMRHSSPDQRSAVFGLICWAFDNITPLQWRYINQRPLAEAIETLQNYRTDN
jgi:hypothetical protein